MTPGASISRELTLRMTLASMEARARTCLIRIMRRRCRWKAWSGPATCRVAVLGSLWAPALRRRRA
eukprot:5884071-Alexandrium_andersonii.AAC.1